MELKQTLEDLNFPDRYQDIIDTIDLEKANDFVKAMINTIVRKYGAQTLRQEIASDNSNSKISNHLTHIIELGGLKIIADNNLDINDRDEFQNIMVSVAFVLNCSLAIELKNLGLYSGSTSNYYGNEAILIIIQRLAKHSMNGMNFSAGFEHHANVMIFDNLIGQLTD